MQRNTRHDFFIDRLFNLSDKIIGSIAIVALTKPIMKAQKELI